MVQIITHPKEARIHDSAPRIFIVSRAMIRIKAMGAACFCATMLASRPVGAYCVVNADIAQQFWGTSFPDLHIPVWVTGSGPNTMAWMGVSPEDVARLTIEVIARHNETVVAPKLYFAGFTSAAYDWREGENPIANLETGISIMSISCDDEFYDGCKSPLSVACANFGFRHDQTDAIGWIRVLPPDCSSATDWSIVEYNDLAQVLLHEIGHTLGLKQSSATKEECEAGGGIHVGDPAGANGVMHGVVPGGFASFRSWRRDDIEGLEHLYGGSAPRHELARWHDDLYPAYPLEASGASLVGMPVTRGATVSNLADSSVQVLVTTGLDGRVVHQLIDSNGDTSPAVDDAVVDPSPAGLTWASPAAAMGEVDGERRVFIGWFANEITQDSLGTLRLATRAEDSLDWSYADHPQQHRVNRVALAFDAIAQEVVLATVQSTSELTIGVFDGAGQPVGPLLVLPSLEAFDVGTPVCRDHRCLIPYSQPAFGGPNFSIAEVEIDLEASTLNLLAAEVHESIDTWGRLSLFEDLDGLWATTGERRFALGDYPGSSPDDAAFTSNPMGAWPIAALRWGGATPQLLQPRAVVCGNGIVQGDELCDDGNLVVGDGCDLCGMDDGAESETGETTDADEVGDDASDGSVEGCECSGSGGERWGWLGVFALAFVRRRGAQPAERRAPAAT